MHLHPGTLLQGGKYRIVRFIKSGGFGCTYEAVHTVFGKRVAIKEFFPKDFCNRDSDALSVTVGTQNKKPLVAKLKKKFIDEAVVLNGLDHSGIVRVSDVFEENDTAYYVMDYIEGGSLSGLVDRDGALEESKALAYIREICSALEYVHSRNRLHLDLKPGNIMLDSAGRTILIDFGTSKQYDEVNGENSSTLMGHTPGYAPLEMYQKGGVSHFTPTTDVYSLGATLYKLLTGERPPEASEVNENGLPALSSRISPAVRNAIEKAMSPRRKDRPQTVAEFRRLLESAPARPRVVIGEETQRTEPSAYSRPESRQNTRPRHSGPSHPNVPPTGPVVPKLVKPEHMPEKPRRRGLVWGIVVGVVALFVSVVVLIDVREKRRKANAEYWDDWLASVETTYSSPDSIENNRTGKEFYSNGVLRVKGVEYPMVYVSGGSFDMGATSEQGGDACYHEKPVHRVTLSGYSIGKYEVTQELWEAVMGNNPSSFKGARRPVEQVSWDDCQDFILKLNSLTGQNFRLPTEAEWEFAARGGKSNKGCKYCGNDTIGNVAWDTYNSGSQTHNVGGKSPNELGIYDMSGNVWEWCYDYYSSYSGSSQTNPKGPGSGSFRVRRGGSWFTPPASCRVSTRAYFTPDPRSSDIGFRLCI